MCLAAAAVFWVLNALNKPGYTMNVDYPVHFVYNDSLFIPTEPLPKTVRVNVSSNGWGLLRHTWFPFQVDPVTYIVKDPMRTSAINLSTLTAALSDHSKKLRVNYVSGDRIDLAFDRRATKTIRLTADSLHIDLAPRFVITSVINLTPHSINISGPRKLVSGLPDTLLVRVPRRHIMDNYDEELPLNQLRHPLLRTNSSRVAVSFEVGELLSSP